MSHHLAEFRISVRPSPETRDHEVCLFGGDEDLIEVFGDRSIGLDPNDVLVQPCPLVVDSSPQDVLIARCDCGCRGCGDVHVRVTRDENLVTWSSLETPSIQRTFQSAAYDAEIARALDDHAWETPERTAARLIAGRVDRDLLNRLGLTFSWASGRARPGVMTVSLLAAAGPYQILVYVPWVGEPPDVVATATEALLRSPPHTWTNVEWFPQSVGLASPSFAGSNWRRGG